MHAADVMQTTNVFLNQGKICELISLSSLDIFSFLVSALLHDINHPGLNNTYQVNSISKHALRYNGNIISHLIYFKIKVY
jgi:hypothetical protein